MNKTKQRTWEDALIDQSEPAPEEATDFREKIKQALTDNPNEVIEVTYNGGYPVSKYSKVLSAVSELAKECIGEDEEFEGIAPHPMLPVPGNAYWHERNDLREEIRQRFKEKLK